MKFQFGAYSGGTIPIKRASSQGTKELISSHYHTAMELMLVERGSLTLCLNGSVQTCYEGQLILVPSCVLHHALTESEDTAVKAIMFEPSLVSRNELNVSPAEMFSKGFSVPYILDCDRATADVFAGLYEMCESSDPSEADVMEILSGLYFILARFTRSFMPSAVEASSIGRIDPVLEYIRKNYRRPIRLDELSDILHVCNDHLIRLFRESTRRTPARYISDLRVEEALRLLVDTDLSVAEIADRVGFSGPNFMAKTFTQKLGISPSIYRKKHRKAI